VAGSGTTSLTFRLTVAANDRDTDGISLGRVNSAAVRGPGRGWQRERQSRPAGRRRTVSPSPSFSMPPTRRSSTTGCAPTARDRKPFVGDDVLDDHPPMDVVPRGPHPLGAVGSRLNASMSRSK